MSFGQNLQFLRKMRNGMTQEALAEMLNVSRQTVSKWELDAAFPEMDKAMALCKAFSCSLDDLIVNNINTDDPHYVNIRLEKVPAFSYARYAVISAEPEDDAIRRVRDMAKALGDEDPDIIGWDFPFVSQEQINVYHMHGYAAALRLKPGFECENAVKQPECDYAVITIKEPFVQPFTIIPKAYRTLDRFIMSNGMKHKQVKEIIPCFEKSYEKDGVTYMDVYISVE